jgi:hypothetical protein
MRGSAEGVLPCKHLPPLSKDPWGSAIPVFGTAFGAKKGDIGTENTHLLDIKS